MAILFSSRHFSFQSMNVAVHGSLDCFLLMQATMSAEEDATTGEQLLLAVQQRILVMTGNACARRVSKAWRDTFDAANDT